MFPVPDERTIHNIDTERYPMKNIKLKDLVEDSYAPVVCMLFVLTSYLIGRDFLEKALEGNERTK